MEIEKALGLKTKFLSYQKFYFTRNDKIELPKHRATSVNTIAYMLFLEIDCLEQIGIIVADYKVFFLTDAKLDFDDYRKIEELFYQNMPCGITVEFRVFEEKDILALR